MLLQFVTDSSTHKVTCSLVLKIKSTSERATVRPLGIPPSYKHGPLALTKYCYPTEA